LSTFDRLKEWGMEVGLSEGEAAFYATEYIKAKGLEAATEAVSCACGCEK